MKKPLLNQKTDSAGAFYAFQRGNSFFLNELPYHTEGEPIPHERRRSHAPLSETSPWTAYMRCFSHA